MTSSEKNTCHFGVREIWDIFQPILSASGIIALELNCRFTCCTKLASLAGYKLSGFSSTAYLFQASRFILDCIREQDDHAEFIANIWELKDFGLQVSNIGHVKFIFSEHHLHRFGLILK